MHHTTGAAEAHHLRRPVVVMPQQRDVLDGDEPLAPHAAFKDTSPPSAHRLHGRPPDIAATVASTRLLEPDQSTSTAPELHCPIDLVEAPHIHVMYSTRDGQRARERGATAAPLSLNRRRASPPRQRSATIWSLSSTET